MYIELGLNLFEVFDLKFLAFVISYFLFEITVNITTAAIRAPNAPIVPMEYSGTTSKGPEGSSGISGGTSVSLFTKLFVDAM